MTGYLYAEKQRAKVSLPKYSIQDLPIEGSGQAGFQANLVTTIKGQKPVNRILSGYEINMPLKPRPKARERVWKASQCDHHVLLYRALEARSARVQARLDAAKKMRIHISVPASGGPVTGDEIKKMVCREFDILPSVLMGKSRQRKFARARHVFWYLAGRYTRLTLNQLGALSGGRDHSTVLYGQNKISTLLKGADEPELVASVRALSAKIERIMPHSRGGSDEPDNLAVACVGCNLSKGDKTPEEWSS